MSNALDHVRHNCGIAGEEVAEMVDELEQQRDELLAALDGEADAVQFLLNWCVKNINKWDFPQYDNVCYWIEKRKAALAKLGADKEEA